MTHPLWQLLLLTQNPDSDVHLDCEECFALLEYDAELLAAGVAPEDIYQAVSRHLAICSACKTEFNDWQEKLRWLQSLQNDPEELINTKENGHHGCLWLYAPPHALWAAFLPLVGGLDPRLALLYLVHRSTRDGLYGGDDQAGGGTGSDSKVRRCLPGIPETGTHI